MAAGPVGFRESSDSTSTIKGGAESLLAPGEVRPFTPGHEPEVVPGTGLWVDPNAAAASGADSPFGLDDACEGDAPASDLWVDPLDPALNSESPFGLDGAPVPAGGFEADFPVSPEQLDLPPDMDLLGFVTMNQVVGLLSALAGKVSFAAFAALLAAFEAHVADGGDGGGVLMRASISTRTQDASTLNATLAPFAENFPSDATVLAIYDDKSVGYWKWNGTVFVDEEILSVSGNLGLPIAIGYSFDYGQSVIGAITIDGDTGGFTFTPYPLTPEQIAQVTQLLDLDGLHTTITNETHTAINEAITTALGIFHTMITGEINTATAAIPPTHMQLNGNGAVPASVSGLYQISGSPSTVTFANDNVWGVTVYNSGAGVMSAADGDGNVFGVIPPSSMAFLFNSAAAGWILRMLGVATVNGQIGSVTLTSADIGLGLVDNTPDSLKPVSTPQAAAIGNAVSTASLDATSKASAAVALAVQRSNHTGTQLLATISDAGNAASRNVGTTNTTVAAGDAPAAAQAAAEATASADATTKADAAQSAATAAAAAYTDDVALGRARYFMLGGM
jgi:hypothetical protein